MSADEERITFIELRGDARVAGGGAFDSMTARDIDLDYTEDGVTLERVALRGSGAVAMKGEREGVSGRQFLGESLDLVFASDSSLVGAVGRDGVRVDLPAAAGAPARNIKARGFNASGEPGKGLTLAQFDDAVEYGEEGRADGPARTARSSSLRAALTDEAITSAVFSGRANFQEGDLQASGAQADYDPVNGTLRLSGNDSGGAPRVSNPDIQVEAESIAVTLGDLRMVASGTVKTVLRQQGTTASRTARPGAAGAAPDGRLPSLLEPGNPVNVNANGLDYQDAAGKAVYSGAAALWQGETAIRGDRLTLDRTRGDFIASGAARSNIVLDTGVSVGRALEIRYDDAERRITYIGGGAAAGPWGDTNCGPRRIGTGRPRSSRRRISRDARIDRTWREPGCARRATSRWTWRAAGCASRASSASASTGERSAGRLARASHRACSCRHRVTSRSPRGIYGGECASR